MNLIRKLKFPMGNSSKPAAPYFQGISKQQLKKRLSREQYSVTQQNGTEKPFRSRSILIVDEYYNCKKHGIYHCVVCDSPLFDSTTKYDSGSGWPAFWDAIQKSKIIKHVDSTFGMKRTEVRCGNCNSHLGHLFDDGPSDKTGQRYCINSASLNLHETKE